MKKSKRRREDRLSELPDSLIFEIFGMLPMRDVVRTTVLSKRWVNLWTTTPYLNFDRYVYGSEFINQALILWRGLQILKFKLAYCYFLDKSVFTDVESWVRLAKENGVEEFRLEDICMRDVYHPNMMYCVPQNLYLCSSLKVLSLVRCSLQNLGKGNVKWNQLRRLTIQECDDLDAHCINQIVSGNPHLEVFNLNFYGKYENLSIRSSSLKKLSIKCFRYSREKPSANVELRIWSPNLETLDIGGVPYGKYSLVDVSSLTHLTLGFSYQICGDDFLGVILGQIFPTLQHVEKLTLSDWCIKVIGAMEDELLLSPLSWNLKFLTINKTFDGKYEQIVDFLQTFPKLKTLVLQSGHYSLIPANHAGSFFHVETNLPKSFLLQLKTVEISWIDGDKSIFPLIEILFKHACKLEKMVIRVTHIPSISLRLALQKLLRMPRPSPTAKLIFVGFDPTKFSSR